VSERRVVVTGSGVLSPLGVGLEAHWAGLAAGRPAARTLPRLQRLGLGSSAGAEVPAEALAPHLARLPRKQQKLYSRMTLLAMIAARLAMDDAGLAPGTLDPSRLGVYLGLNVLGLDLGLLLDYLGAAESGADPGELDMARANAHLMRSINPLEYSIKTLPNLTAGHVAIAHDARGICRVYTDGAPGGLLAVGDAFEAIRDGDLDVALSGGADAPLEDLVYASAAGMGILARDGRGGMVPAEGSAVLVLEDEARARARGALPRARLRAVRSLAGGARLAPESEPDALARRLGRVMGEALEVAGLERPDLLVLHRDGTPALDEGERLAVEGLGARRPRATLAPKTLSGHLGPAAAAADLATCSEALRRAMLPGAAGPPPRTAMVNAVGLFGEVACALLEAAGGADAG
jgi:3-oxoacyl-(acyl-carrier-protein) synthase